MQSDSRIALDYKQKPDPTSGGTHARSFAIALGFTLIAGAATFFLSRSPSFPTAESIAPPALTSADLPTLSPDQIIAQQIPEPIGDTIEFVVRRNDTLDRIFRQLKLDLSDLATIRAVPGVRTGLDQLRPGDIITFIHKEGLIHTMSRRISETQIMSVTRGDTGFEAEFIDTPVELRTIRAHGRIETSLFVAARAAGVSSELVMKLANDIFGWKIDFALEIQPGDEFNIVYQQKYRDGQHIGDGRILAAEFKNAGTSHRAVYYESDDGNIKDYFGTDGKSMHRQFLRAPLDFTRISSNFNPNRRHPILNTIRAHRGVDYAAATGTVIKAAGDGRVSFVGTKGGYGRVVILEHGNGITTLYGHMSRFAKSLRNGQRVRQSETIGYVGMSGAATGPHLHYEYRVHGVHKNPRTVPLPDAAPIPQKYMADFQARSGGMLAELDRARDAALVAKPIETR